MRHVLRSVLITFLLAASFNIETGFAAELNSGRADLPWAFLPPADSKPDLSSATDQAWAKTDIDLFVFAQLKERGLSPAPTADRQTLIRRITFDLLGLPPTPDEVDAFVKDTSPQAAARLVDRLLNSPRYGERWGRHWLDVARYADSNGLDENIAHGNAWRYRDYVIRSFNRDKPFDQFVIEQLAGDLLPTSDVEAERHDRLIATGFLSLGPKVLAEVDEAKMEMDIVDEQVDTFGRAFLAITLGCARCHDHKFDPITTRDYHALAGIFKSTKTMEHFTKIARWHEIPIPTQQQSQARQAAERKIAETKARIASLSHDSATPDRDDESTTAADGAPRDETRSVLLARLQTELKSLEESLPALPFAMGVVDYEKPTDVRIHNRGSHLQLGDVVPRGIPAALATGDVSLPSFDDQASGRLALARWLVQGQCPLVARVMANRIWRWHFGRGLSESTDNFGQLGQPPTHPRLLDWLSREFVNRNWSIKAIHRLILLSSTYQMSSQFNSSNAAIDPDNRFLWRAPVRRLEAEAIRDSMLSVAGVLDTTQGGSLLHVKNREFLFDHTSKDETTYNNDRRSVYLPVIRNHLYELFQLFDYSDASVLNSNRPTTTVASQALFIMNSPLVNSAALNFSNRVINHGGDSFRSRLTFAYVWALGRPPSEQELTRDEMYFEQFMKVDPSSKPSHEINSVDAWRLLCHMLLASNEFAYVR